MVLPPYDVEVIRCDAVPCLDAVHVDGGMVLQVLLEPFSKCPGGFPYVLLIACNFFTLVVICCSTFLIQGVLIFGFD